MCVCVLFCNMSKTLQKVANFLKLLLSTTKDQAKALFYTLTPVQTLALCEILFNIQKHPLTARVAKELQKRKYLIKKLTDKNTSVSRKLTLIQNHYRQIQHTLELVKKELLEILE